MTQHGFSDVTTKTAFDRPVDNPTTGVQVAATSTVPRQAPEVVTSSTIVQRCTQAPEVNLQSRVETVTLVRRGML